MVEQPNDGSSAAAAPLADGVQRVARVLRERAHPHAPVLLDGSARSAQQAADGLGVALGQIARSIVFRRRADGAFVKAKTGFSIGGVAPVALIDRELFRFAEVWAAAGHPHAVFRLHPQQLPALADAQIADVVEQPPSPGTA